MSVSNYMPKWSSFALNILNGFGRVQGNRYYLILATGAVLFLLLKYVNIAPKLSDEGFYFYNAKLLLEGVWPYRDFFFQHLPGQLLLLSGTLGIWGFSLTVLKTIPLLFTLGSAWFLYRIVKGELKETTGALAAGLFLFSFTVLTTTDHGTGVHEATFFLLLFWWLLARVKGEGERVKISSPLTQTATLRGYALPFFAGLALFVGLTFRIYILPAALGILAYWVISEACRFAVREIREVRGVRVKVRRIFVLLLSSSIPYLVLNVSLWKAFGDKFLDPVWRYHLLKSEGIDKGKVLGFFATNEWFLLGVGIVGVIGVIGGSIRYREQVLEVGRFGNPRTLHYALFGLLGQLGFLLIFADIYYFYLLTLVPFLVIFAVWLLSSLPQRWAIGIVAAIAFWNFANYQENHAGQSVIKGLDRIVRDVRDLSKPDGTIFGPYTLAPLIALQADRKIIENQVDTNAKRYRVGLLSKSEATRLATESSIFIQLATANLEGKFTSLDPDFVAQSTIRDKCELVRTYTIPKDYERNTILLWKCKK